MSHEENDGDEAPSQAKEDLFVELQDQDDPGFRAFVLHSTKLESLLHIWKSLVPVPMDDDDRLVMDELRQAIKILLADKTHEKYLKMITVHSSIQLFGDKAE